MRLAILALSLVTVLFTGCAKGPYTIQTSFNADEMEWANRQGSAVVRGQAFLKTVGGDVKTCAGNTIQLGPASAYTREMATAAGAGAQQWANKDARLAQFIRNTKCDAQGNFLFSGVPGGEWIVTAPVSWGVPTGYYGAIAQQGGRIFEEISVQDGETKNLVITR